MPHNSFQPVITVGMPVYNGAAFIEQALEALLAQTFRPFTLIIADNASTDGTWDILQDWARRDPRIILHRHDRNIGAMKNFRYVLNQAQTEYFMWHAHDDWLAPNYLEELVGIISNEPACSLVCSRILKVAMDGTQKECLFPDLTGTSRTHRIAALLRRPRGIWFYGLSRTTDLSRAYRRAEDFDHPWGGDVLVLLSFILKDKVRGSNRTSFYYRMTGLSCTIYCPVTMMEQLRFMRRFLCFNIRIFLESGLSPLEKLVCWPWIMRYVCRLAIDAGPLRVLHKGL